MKKLALLTLPITIIVALCSCSGPLDKPISADTLDEATAEIDKSDTLSPGKKKFVKEMISMSTGLATLAGGRELPTYKSLLVTFGNQYDSTARVIKMNAANNEKLKSLLKIKEVAGYNSSQYKCYLTMNLEVNNQFGKDILYMIINYKYVNKYDTKYFDEKAKLTDNLIKGNVINASIRDEYNDVCKFLWSVAPADHEKRTKFIMEGIIIEPILVVFTDKTQVELKEDNWEYL